jgi:hypothetical protein
MVVEEVFFPEARVSVIAMGQPEQVICEARLVQDDHYLLCLATQEPDLVSMPSIRSITELARVDEVVISGGGIALLDLPEDVVLTLEPGAYSVRILELEWHRRGSKLRQMFEDVMTLAILIGVMGGLLGWIPIVVHRIWKGNWSGWLIAGWSGCIATAAALIALHARLNPQRERLERPELWVAATRREVR